MVAPLTTAVLDYDPVAAKYLATWNATDPVERLALLRRHWAPEATYIDPLADVSGWQAISSVIGKVHRQFADMRFTLVGEPDGHHRQLRFRWGLGPGGAEPLVIGFDVVTLDDTALIHDVRGFLDVVPG